MTDRTKLLDPKGLRTGKPCPDQHHQADGMGLRLRENGQCLGCRLRLPPGLIPMNYENLPTAKVNRTYATAEEAYENHLERVRAYNDAHREQRRLYAREYSRRPEVQEARRAKARDKQKLKDHDE